MFSIPGWDTTIGYNSFNRYKFECWDIGKECHQITSEYAYPKLTQITIVYKDRRLYMYQDGKLVGKKIIKRRLLDTKQDNFYIGIASVDREDDRKSFRGFVNDFAYWDKALEVNEIQGLHQNKGMSFMVDDKQYSSSDNLKIYYDFKHTKFNNSYDYTKGSVMDLIHPRIKADVYNSIPKPIQDIERKKISIPARRESTFKLIGHPPEGYKEGGWKYESTRLNQIRYYKQILDNKSNLDDDGLSTLKFKTNSKTDDGNYTFLSVNLDL